MHVFFFFFSPLIYLGEFRGEETPCISCHENRSRLLPTIEETLLHIRSNRLLVSESIAPLQVCCVQLTYSYAMPFNSLTNVKSIIVVVLPLTRSNCHQMIDQQFLIVHIGIKLAVCSDSSFGFMRWTLLRIIRITMILYTQHCTRLARKRAYTFLSKSDPALPRVRNLSTIFAIFTNAS